MCRLRELGPIGNIVFYQAFAEFDRFMKLLEVIIPTQPAVVLGLEVYCKIEESFGEGYC